MKRIASIFISLCLLFSMTACVKNNPTIVSPDDAADKILYGGDIITIDENSHNAEAVAIKAGKIIALGKKTEVFSFQGDNTEMLNLEGKTLLPSFIDSHSHINNVSITVDMADLSSPPVGNMNNIADIKNKLKKHIQSRQFGNDEIIWGFGYDDSLLEEKRHPNKFDLDEVSTEKPIVVLHISGHVGVANSRALEIFGYNSETKDPAGGHIGRVSGSNEPNGILEETAVYMAYGAFPAKTIEGLVKAQEYYLSHGITTAQEGAAFKNDIELLANAAKEKKMKIDIIAYSHFSNNNKEYLLHHKLPVGKYQDGLKLGGVKLTLDGSPQGKTAWLTEPYFVVPEGKDADYKGYPTMTDEQVEQFVKEAFENDWQVLAHANGDAAADQYIKVIEKASQTTGKKDLRPVMIHAQTVRDDQLDEMKELEIIPSFFNAHTFYWGDWHINSVLGKERAYRISPVKSALDRNIPFTLHQDSPVIPPDMLYSIWCAVNRTTRSGEIIGPDQRISVMDAIKAVTINAAYQYFEEDTKGSISIGKNADLVILSQNPLKVDPQEIKNIKVVETIKDGKTLFKK
ncbi:amidohydrolase family protein [Clostridium sediminicola]|uniref:amidohydrolase n=1 Tax=Clostridium sediminicola TaxID=3114879 RepID=UPI0031F1D9F4